MMREQGITWPNWNDGAPDSGPIAKLYHVQGYPTVFVIDAKGTIRSKNSHGGALVELVEKLVAEQESAGKPVKASALKATGMTGPR